MRYKIAKVILSVNKELEFDYSIEKLKPKLFDLVLVDFRGKPQIGIVVAFSEKSEAKNIKPILKIFTEKPILTKEHFLFAKKLSNFYSYPLGVFLFMMLPDYIKKIKKKSFSIDIDNKKGKFDLKPIKIFIKRDNFIERYEVIKKYISKNLENGSVMICFPNISYLEYAKKIIEKDFNVPINIFYSRESKLQNFNTWLNSRKNSIILGTRMAIFYYPYDLQLLIIEDENNSCYFQEEKPYYNLLNVAFLLADLKKINLILSSDYPSLYTYKLIKENKIVLDEAEDKKEINVVGVSYSKEVLSPLFLDLVKKNISEGEKIALIFNKKGYAKIAKCLSCGYIVSCNRCSSFLNIYFEQNIGICPYCNSKIELPKMCPKCNSGYIKWIGFGIERFKIMLKRLFSDFKIVSIDENFKEVDIMLSTSKILNRFEYMNKFLGFVYDIDWFISKEDYEATFNAYLYIRKLANFFKKTYVFTHMPNYYVFEELLNWKNFYEKELSQRKEFKLPPYYSICKIILRGKTEHKVFEKINNLYNKFKDTLEIYGPFKDSPFKLRGNFRYFLIIKSKNPYMLHKIIKEEIFSIRSSNYKVALVIR